MSRKREPDPPTRRHWPLLGFLGGWLIALLDLALFKSTDLVMYIGEREATVGVTLFFGLTFALLGYAVGRLAVARLEARADHRIISEQHAALVRSQAELVQQEKLAALGRLVASIAHELRNPLGVIRSAAGVLREKSGHEPQLVRAAELVSEEVDRLNATITALLTFARPARLKLEELSVASLLERARRLTEEKTRAARIEVTSRLPEGLPPVAGDFNLLAQVLAGLVMNATEALEATDGREGAGGFIELRARETSGDVRIEVADDGPGISREESAKIFEPFFTTKDAGTGLGLALAHRVLDVHRGRLEVIESAGLGPERRGACLRLSLPAAAGLPATAAKGPS